MRLSALFDFSLGRDFWNYRFGQLVSLLGDSCSHIALAWWILEKTESAAAMSSVLAPAMVTRIVLLPLLGPFGDRFSRKTLIVIADVWRFFFTGALASMVFFDFFNLPLLTAVFACISVGSALFNSVATGIVPQIVPRNKIQVASQQTHAINSFASIVGGILGGVVVSTVGVFGAFFIDTISYLAATIFSSLIRADTKPNRKETLSKAHPIVQWQRELTDGFSILYRLPVLFWICGIAMLMNLSLSPLGIVLPVLAKEARGMPAWFLGGLESSIGLGAIVGAMSITLIQRVVRPHLFFVAAIAMIGVGVCLLPWVPNVLLPLSVLFWIGIGSSWANILLGTQISLTLPDSYRARIGSIMGFMCNGISPLGVAAAGYLIAFIGLDKSLLVMGATVALLAPLMLAIPLLKEFLSVRPESGSEFFNRYYPGIFDSNALADTESVQSIPLKVN